jgi:hypothetical protein
MNSREVTLRTNSQEVPRTAIDALALFLPGGFFLLVGAATGRREGVDRLVLERGNGGGRSKVK